MLKLPPCANGIYLSHTEQTEGIKYFNEMELTIYLATVNVQQVKTNTYCRKSRNILSNILPVLTVF